MKVIFTFIFVFMFSISSYADSFFNKFMFDGHKSANSETAVDYISYKLNPKFPKSVTIKQDKVKISGENFIIITFYYSEYDGATRGSSQYFISFWKDYKDHIVCVGSNILNIYSPVLSLYNNIITIKGKRQYEPLSVYNYSFIYENNNFYFYNILSITEDADKNVTYKYYFKPEDKKVNIKSIYADEFIKE